MTRTNREMVQIFLGFFCSFL
ncbi:hypothetical protein Patl1_30587 [Pistacia atlantica]|uniref:Uncharacterized protein n=1 Tax=Pistacia atlantica TaxID=434234 RepID=A0ACC1ABM2_9ROSI|nr:hypothetical protein Patl1_30587 [Pistacia atlantica]